MAVVDKTTLQSNINTAIADNTSSAIVPEDVRENMIDITDSYPHTDQIRPEALVATSPIQTLTDAATINWDVTDGVVAEVTLGGNRTVAAPTGMEAGITYTLIVVQDGTGSRTLTWNAFFKFNGGTAPTLTTVAGRANVFPFIAYDNGTDIVLLSADFGSAVIPV